jgi:hypothetical protein
MPLDPITVSGMVLVNETANLLIGVSNIQLALGVANGLFMYATAGLTAQTIDVGVFGTGVGVGVGIILPPPVLASAFATTFPPAPVIGIAAPSLINALSVGLSIAFATAIITTVHPTVGSGAGVVTPIPNTGVSIPAFIAGFTSAGLLGIGAKTLATAIATGLDMALPSGKGAVVISGSASIAPSSGVGFGKIT